MPRSHKLVSSMTHVWKTLGTRTQSDSCDKLMLSNAPNATFNDLRIQTMRWEGNLGPAITATTVYWSKSGHAGHWRRQWAGINRAITRAAHSATTPHPEEVTSSATPVARQATSPAPAPRSRELESPLLAPPYQIQDWAHRQSVEHTGRSSPENRAEKDIKDAVGPSPVTTALLWGNVEAHGLLDTGSMVSFVTAHLLETTDSNELVKDLAIRPDV